MVGKLLIALLIPPRPFAVTTSQIWRRSLPILPNVLRNGVRGGAAHGVDRMADEHIIADADGNAAVHVGADEASAINWLGCRTLNQDRATPADGHDGM